MVFIDTETCGLYGIIALIQHAKDDGEVELFCPWHNPVRDTLELIEEMSEDTVCGFNLAFDWFHINKLYNIFRLLDPTKEPVIAEAAAMELKARDGVCVKPRDAVDLMLIARKGPYQSTMRRKDLRIKRVPTILAYELQAILDQKLQLPDIYFERKKDKTIRWQTVDILDDCGDMIPDFKDIVLKFAPSSSLKALVVDALKRKPRFFYEVALNEYYNPSEVGWYPLAHGDKPWPQLLREHISHWAYNKIAREYAKDDVTNTRDLYKYFGYPVPDYDSRLACMVAAVRWKGFKINEDRINALRDVAIKNTQIGISYNSPKVVRYYMEQVLSDIEKMAMQENGKTTTKGVVLEAIAKWKTETVCDDCMGMGCEKCSEGVITTDEPHPAAIRAQTVLDARHAKKEIELYDKLLLAGRFHASLIVIGAKSSRMSGADGLNAQGIKRSDDVRSSFPLAWDNMVLCGGDFDSFEVSIADAAYHDPKMHEMLESGMKIHAIVGQFFFDGGYEGILATKGLAGEKDLYARSKNGTFALIYMGEAHTLHTRVGIPVEIAERGFRQFLETFPHFANERQVWLDRFCTMKQPGGIGSRVIWEDADDYSETMLGFKRFFTLENQVCKVLFDLSNKPPVAWKRVKVKYVRRDREQTAEGSVRSALLAAAFALQAANMRAAGNHRIQGTGAQITKMLQDKLWELQPHGISNWRVMPLNVHDEVMCPATPEVAPQTKIVADAFVEEIRGLIPLAQMTWKVGMTSWGEK
mgnify:CR=1 FL=1|tara:strand:- start:925 stop:3183 length:2259 start_codon:yes stop_codon:yes gene_type:complete